KPSPESEENGFLMSHVKWNIHAMRLILRAESVARRIGRAKVVDQHDGRRVATTREFLSDFRQERRQRFGFLEAGQDERASFHEDECMAIIATIPRECRHTTPGDQKQVTLMYLAHEHETARSPRLTTSRIGNCLWRKEYPGTLRRLKGVLQ